MSSFQLKYRKLDYNNLTECIVYTDIPIIKCEDDTLAVNENIMIQCVNGLSDLEWQISKATKNDKVLHILFVFQYIQVTSNFDKKILTLFQKCKQKFPNAKSILCLNDNREPEKSTYSQLINQLNVEKIDILEKPLENGEAFKIYIEFELYGHYPISAYSIYSSNPKLIAFLLKKRCRQPFQFQFDPDSSVNFTIMNGKNKLHFVFSDNCYSVFEHSLSDNPFLILRTEQIFGLYNFDFLFEIIQYLVKMGNNHRVAVINNELVFFDFLHLGTVILNPNYSLIVSKIIKVFDRFSEMLDSKKFKIQLSNDNCFVFNRQLKVSLTVLNALFTCGDRIQTVYNLARLSFLYFKCFSTVPVCCRMQSLAPKAIVYDFEIFTHHHIDINRSLYIKICKFLYHYIADIDDEILLRKYLEIMPVSLIQRFHGKKLQEFVERLQIFKQTEISVIPQPNGNFKVKNENEILPKDFCAWCMSSQNGGENVANSDAFFTASSASVIKQQRLWKHNESRFFFKSKIEQHEREKFKAEFRSFEISEGVCLALLGKRIETLEDTTLLENGVIEYNEKDDYCYYNEDELEKFMKKVKTEFELLLNSLNSTASDDENELGRIMFEVTTDGLIRFEESVIISPVTFLRIKDTNRLVKLIKRLCSMLRNSIVPKTTTIKTISGFNKRGLRNLVPIAKYLNPLLDNLDEEYFRLYNFCCLPGLILDFYQVDVLYETLADLRKNNSKAALSSIHENRIETDRIGFHVDMTEFASFIPNFVMSGKLLEQINENFDGFICIKNFKFVILHYSQCSIIDPTEYNLTKKDMENLFALFKESNVQHVAILENKEFVINRAINIHQNNLLKLSSANFTTFLELTNICRDHRYFSTWISLAKEYNSAKSLQHGKKFNQFAVNAENLNNYLEFVKLLTPCLEHIPDKDILSSEWLEVLPSHLLINTSSLEKLLDILKRVKRHGHEICCTEYGISTKIVDLHVNFWLQMKSMEKLCAFLDYYNEVFNRQKMTKNENPFFHFGGKICLCNKKTQIPPNYSKLVLVVKTLIDYMIQTENYYPITIGALGDIMLGNYIWSYIDYLDFFTEQFFSTVKLFQDAIRTKDLDLMRGIAGLHNNEKAIKLVKAVNPSLCEFSDRDISSKHLRVLPTQLWKLCNENEQTYEKSMQVFHMLKKEKIWWELQLNGNFSIDEVIIVTIDDLLALNDKPNNLKEKAKALKQLAKQLEDRKFMYLTCSDEFMQRDLKIPNFIDTGNLSYAEIIALKKQILLEQRIEKIRIEPMGTFFVNEHLIMKARTALRCDVAELSKMAKKVFPHTIFHCEPPKERLYISLITSSDEQLYRYCLNVCELIKEEYPDIKFKYLTERNMFEFNDVLCIHPRSFFHLQDIEKVVEVLKKLKIHKSNFDNFENAKKRLSPKENAEKKQQLDTEESNLFKELWIMKKEERLEFDVIKAKFYEKLGEVLWKYKDSRLNSIANINELTPMKPYKGVEGIRIQDELIFQNGSSLLFVNIDKNTGNLKFEYSDEHIIEAIKLADKLNPEYKCKSLFDFQSLVEIVRSYANFKKKPQNKMSAKLLTKPHHEQINWWLKQVQAQQEKPNLKHKFYNALKGLHHWFKHPDGFDDLKEYYAQMNKFFDTSNYVSEIDYQNGQFISRHYDNKIYTGYYGIAFEESGNENYVASFWSLAPKIKSKIKAASTENGIPLKNQKENSDATFLVITDTDFSCFKSNDEISLNQKIIVKTPSMAPPDLLKLHKSIRGATYGTMKNVMFFLPQTLKNKIIEKIPKKTAKGKEFDIKENDFLTSFNDFTNFVREKFPGAEIIVCYPHDMDTENLEIMKQNSSFELVEIDSSMMEEKNAVEIKNFIESKLNID